MVQSRVASRRVKNLVDVATGLQTHQVGIKTESAVPGMDLGELDTDHEVSAVLLHAFQPSQPAGDARANGNKHVPFVDHRARNNAFDPGAHSLLFADAREFDAHHET